MTHPYRSRPGYTLVEILTATVLMIIIMMAVTVIFANVTDSIGQSRATLEMSQRLRSTAAMVKQDLENVTAVMNPPLHPRANQGYFQYVEGPIGPVIYPSNVALNTELNLPDATLGDIDDIIMFTAKTKGKPYVGLIDGMPSVSNTAEIIYFVRGTTLYRRVLLIKPEVGSPTWTDSSGRTLRQIPREGFYQNYDLSVRKSWEDSPIALPGLPVQYRPVLAANSLADLTRPEARFAHHPDMRVWWTRPQPTTTVGIGSSPKLGRGDVRLRYRNEGKPFPFFLRPWLGSPCDATAAGDLADPPIAGFRWAPGLGLPILAECADPNWVAGDAVPSENWIGIDINTPSQVQMPQFAKTIAPTTPFDPWTNPHPWRYVEPTNFVLDAANPAVDPLTGVTMQFATGTRPGEDVIMTNVIGFDVKAWDPKAAVFTQRIENPPGTLVDEVVVRPGDPGYITTIGRLRGHMAAGTLAGSGLMAITGAYVDLNYAAEVPETGVYPDAVGSDMLGTALPIPRFHREGNWASRAYGTRSQFVGFQQPYDYFPSVYDTWSLHYEYNRRTVRYFSENPTDANYATVTEGNEDNDYEYPLASPPVPLFDEGSNGLDDVVHDLQANHLDIYGLTIPTSTDPPLYQNGVDDVAEREVPPPYAVPLQGIQIRIRVFEPSSRQVREVTLIQKFRTK